MKRDIDTKFVEWEKNEFRKSLIIRGARQVGKTYPVCRSGEKYFETFIKLDFERDRTSHRIFQGDLSAERLFLELEIHSGTRIDPGTIFLFFDEIHRKKIMMVEERVSKLKSMSQKI